MANLNKVMLIGNLTRDPEVRYTPKGTAVGDLSIAVNRSFKGQDGQFKEEVCYVDIVTWGRDAENAKQYLAKGRSIFVEGRLQLDQWESKEGEKKSRLQVIAERIQFLGGRPGSEGGSPPRRSEGRPEGRPEAAPARSQAPATPAEDFPQDAPNDDDVPF